MPEPDSGHPSRAQRLNRLGWTGMIGAFGAVVLLMVALALSYVVAGSSMEPTLDDGDRVLVDPRRGLADLERFDVVHARAGVNDVSVVKRVIGLPGDRVAIGPASEDREATVWVQVAGHGAWQRVEYPADHRRADSRPCCTRRGMAGSQIEVATVPSGQVFLLGDNLSHSDDSRVFGWVRGEDITGVFVLRMTPLAGLGRLQTPPHLVPAHESPPGQGSAS